MIGALMPDYQRPHGVIHNRFHPDSICSPNLLVTLWASCSVTAVSIALYGLWGIDHYLNSDCDSVVVCRALMLWITIHPC